jgi:hypothetical protein
MAANIIEATWATADHEPTLNEPAPRLSISFGHSGLLQGYVNHVDDGVYVVHHERYLASRGCRVTDHMLFDVTKVVWACVWSDRPPDPP